jgi:hypothetical protein
MRLINGTGGQPEELRLPPSYRLDRSDPDVLVLRRPDGSVVARYSARGHTKETVELERERMTKCEAGPPKKDEGRFTWRKKGGEKRLETAHCAAGRNGAHGGDDGSETGGREDTGS